MVKLPVTFTIPVRSKLALVGLVASIPAVNMRILAVITAGMLMRENQLSLSKEVENH